jgi:preflagellin peptidase FlaK
MFPSPSVTMAVPDIVPLALFVITVAVLGSAAASDVRTRTVRDLHWAVIGLAGIVFWLIASWYQGAKWEHLAMAAGSGVIMFDVLWDSDRSKAVSAAIYGSVFVFFLVPYALSPSDPSLQAEMTVPAFYVLYMLMYAAGLLKGGADAKCMISLAVAFPVYPEFWHFPLIDVPEGVLPGVFVFSAAVLFHALLFSLSGAAYIFLRNLRYGYIGSRALHGYLMDIDDAEKSHVWPMDDTDGERLFRIPIPEDPSEIYSRLRSYGEKEIWVTPMIPFILPVFASVVFVGLAGNLLFFIL